MIASIQAVINFLTGCFERLFGLVREPVMWLVSTIAVLLLAPANIILGVCEWAMGLAELNLERLNAALDSVGLNQVGSYYSQFSSVVAMADAWVPASFAVQVAIALTTLYMVCMLIRLIIRCLGAISGG